MPRKNITLADKYEVIHTDDLALLRKHAKLVEITPETGNGMPPAKPDRVGWWAVAAMAIASAIGAAWLAITTRN